jgi:hypothetical protein
MDGVYTDRVNDPLACVAAAISLNVLSKPPPMTTFCRHWFAAAAAHHVFLAVMAAIERKTTFKNCCKGRTVAAICDTSPL